MAEQTMTSFNQSLGRLVMPYQRVSLMALDGFERLTRFQLNTAQSYSHLLLSQWRDAMEVHDGQTLREFFDHQTDAISEFSRRFADDFHALATIGQAWSNEAQKVAEENVRAMSDLAQKVDIASEREATRPDKGSRSSV